DQGLLPHVVRTLTGEAVELPGDGTETAPSPSIDPAFTPVALLIGPAERYDVIVDFTEVTPGKMVRMINTGPDEPFGGFDEGTPLPDPLTTAQVMQFKVDDKLNKGEGDQSTHPAALRLNKRKPAGAPRLKKKADRKRDLALLEEESAEFCVTIDDITGVITQVAGDPTVGCPDGSDPFGPKAAVLGYNGSQDVGTVQLWDDDLQDPTKLNDVEVWELWNQSADAHPIHLHLVKFEVVNRQIFGGAKRKPELWERGWKDTVIAYPGEVTRIKAKFDIEGLYVWHCHLLSHEDNEMMVPYCVEGDTFRCPLPTLPAL
ncbi:MAG: multicopper oxidase domain-containing protein, partial [Gammaproteobacteria bacterium]